MSKASKAIRQNTQRQWPELLSMMQEMARYERAPGAPMGTYTFQMKLLDRRRLERAGLLVVAGAKVRLTALGREIATN